MHWEARKVCVTCFIAIFVLLQWSGTESVISLRPFHIPLLWGTAVCLPVCVCRAGGGGSLNKICVYHLLCTYLLLKICYRVTHYKGFLNYAFKYHQSKEYEHNISQKQKGLLCSTCVIQARPRQ